MSEAKHTPGPWLRDLESGFDCDVRAANGRKIASVNVQCMPRTKQQFDGRKAENNANAYLIAAAPTMKDEMKRHLPLLERLENDAELWGRLTDGLGIATLNGYRAAIAAATGGAA